MPSDETHYDEGQQIIVGHIRAERDAEVAAHLEAELDAMPEAEPFDEWWDGKAGALTDLLAWLEVGEVETPSPEPPADEKDSE